MSGFIYSLCKKFLNTKMVSNMRLFIAVLLMIYASQLYAQDDLTVSSSTLSARLAQQVASVALHECAKLGYQVGVAVVDRGGNLLAFIRDPLSGAHTIDISEKKAFTSASTRVATGQLSNNSTLNFSERLITLQGGLPISIGGHIYGGVGVSGATSEDDEKCAQAGIEAIKEDIEFSQ